MTKLNVGNRNLTFKEKIPLEKGVTCVYQTSVHLHFTGMYAVTRRSYLDSGYTLATHCQLLDRHFTEIDQTEMDRINSNHPLHG